MTGLVILDTNVISEIVRDRPDPAVTAWYLRQESNTLYTTAVTLAEVHYGLDMLPEGKRRERLAGLCSAVFDTGLRGRILPFDEFAAPHYARILSLKRRAGLAMSGFDAQIAAIAFAVGASVATRNVSDFEGCGVALVNPWPG